jgi:hypothetical protein
VADKRANAGALSIDLQTPGLAMTATMAPATMAPATMAPATMAPAAVFAAVVFAAVVFAAVVSFTVEFAEAFAAESVAVEGRVAVTVRGIAVVSVTPVGTSRQPKDPNQKRAKDNQFYFHYLMRRQAGRMTSGAEELLFTAGLATAATAFRTPASVLTLKPEH